MRWHGNGCNFYNGVAKQILVYLAQMYKDPNSMLFPESNWVSRNDLSSPPKYSRLSCATAPILILLGFDLEHILLDVRRGQARCVMSMVFIKDRR